MCKIFSLRITHHVLFFVNYIITIVNFKATSIDSNGFPFNPTFHALHIH